MAIGQALMSRASVFLNDVLSSFYSRVKECHGTYPYGCLIPYFSFQGQKRVNLFTIQQIKFPQTKVWGVSVIVLKMLEVDFSFLQSIRDVFWKILETN